jgi:hypothetical protein
MVSAEKSTSRGDSSSVRNPESSVRTYMGWTCRCDDDDVCVVESTSEVSAGESKKEEMRFPYSCRAFRKRMAYSQDILFLNDRYQRSSA